MSQMQIVLSGRNVMLELEMKRKNNNIESINEVNRDIFSYEA